ncbi:hypothetical protein PoB_003676100 [Plakobranchus ocellatus]|uniref:Uncharacterized protein n=1 Tax=Plakobranchus ocellatus TaxID=259542 RepID=A0AAV4AGE8_9GAST|nr:hypothetical protein PoB_003676100 [Plakobranchus ocellatus]
MAGTKVISRESSAMDSTLTKSHPRSQPVITRRSASGGGDSGTAGLGHTRSHTMDSTATLGQSKSRSRNGHGLTNGILNSTGANKDHRNHSSQHYQHKHSRVVGSHTTKTFTSSNNKPVHSGNSHTSTFERNHTSDLPLHHNAGTMVSDSNNNNNSTNIVNKNNSGEGGQNNVQIPRKSSRRTVSLPKAGSRLFSQNFHQNALSSSTDVGNRNRNSNPNTIISSATTCSHNLSDIFIATNTNNVFPPIPGGHVIAARLSSDDGLSNLESGVKGEPSSLSPRNPSGTAISRLSVRGALAGAGPSVPTSPPEVPLSRLHFLSEPTFDSLHPRTPPIKSSHNMINGAGGSAMATGADRRNIKGTDNSCAAPSSNMIRNSSLSPEDYATQQQQPFSPVSSSERAKGKFEKKIQLSAVTEGSITSQLPSSNGNKTATGAEGAVGSGAVVNNTSTNAFNNSNSFSKDSNKTKPRKDNTKALPKIYPPEEPFSIRKKIEQFRKWHEEQYIDKLKRFESDVVGGGAGRESSPGGVRTGNLQNASNGLVDYAKVLEGKIAAGNSENVNYGDFVAVSVEIGGLAGKAEPQKTYLQHFGRDPETCNRKHAVTTIVSRDGPERVTEPPQARPISAATWKTWRDVNTSDAYKDVKKYIRDNDLMDEEREAWIKSWIADVEQAMGDVGDQSPLSQRAK